MFAEPYLGTIGIFAGNFAPRGWKLCDGQLLYISEYDALYALIGTTYGGDDVQTFALPDLRGRVAVHTGQAPGFNNYFIGDKGGTETVTLLSAYLPPHTHTYVSLTGAPGASSADATLPDPIGHVPAVTKGINNYNTAGTGKMAVSTNQTHTVPTGSSIPVNNIPPVLAMNYVIAVEGVFPSRN